MTDKPKSRSIYTAIHVLLWMTFICAINDPLISTGHRPANSPTTSISFLLDPLYAACNWVTWPVQWLATVTHLYTTTTDFFPIAAAPALGHWLSDTLGWTIIQPNSFAGGLIWWLPITSIILLFMPPVVEFFYWRVHNAIWNLFIEYGFQRKKTREYAQILNQKNEDLNRLNTQYRALAEEAHTLKDSVITDELTMVFNKRFFLNRLKQAFDSCKKEQQPLSLIMIDIDFFKKMNDTYGHLSGDKVLKAVADVIKRYTPDLCFPCRYGGEEFSVIMPNKHLEQANHVARLIQENIQMIRLEEIDNRLRVTVSQGVCTVEFSQPGARMIKNFDHILELADQELYRSKIEGRNRVSSQLIARSNDFHQP